MGKKNLVWGKFPAAVPELTRGWCCCSFMHPGALLTKAIPGFHWGEGSSVSIWGGYGNAVSQQHFLLLSPMENPGITHNQGQFAEEWVAGAGRALELLSTRGADH